MVEKKSLGFTVHEFVSVGVYNPRAVRKSVCPVCGEAFLNVVEHCAGKEDLGHLLIFIMES
jgi:hypothetical protein